MFRHPEAFFDYRRYKRARTGLNAFFGLLTAVHYPTTLTPAAYPTATMLGTMEHILTHQSRDLNPYVRYYEEVLLPLIDTQHPALVGISMVFANQSVQALVLGRMIKTRFPLIHVALGGAYLSQWVMTAGDRQVEQLLDCADTIVCGEGEQALIDLLGCVPANASPAGRPNIICRDAATQKPVRFDHLEYTDISGQPPPDFSDLNLGSYLVPLNVARMQQAKAWELRTATSLVRLWQQQGKRRAAYDLIASAYQWYTEGFDTEDLKAAKSLIDALQEDLRLLEMDHHPQ